MKRKGRRNRQGQAEQAVLAHYLESPPVPAEYRDWPLDFGAELDKQYFDANPSATRYARTAVDGEAELLYPDAPPGTLVIVVVQQVAPGVRAKQAHALLPVGRDG